MIAHRGVALIVAVLLCPTLLFAHARSESYSNWNLGNDSATGVVTVTAAEVTPLIELSNSSTPEELFAQHLLDTTAVFADAEECGSTGAQPLNAARGFVRIELAFACNTGPPSRIVYEALFDALPEHVHFARVFSADALLGETVFTARNTIWAAADGRVRHSFTDFFSLGVEHILGGVDHIAFLVGLLLLAGTLGMGVAAVTGFTIGHSISLAAAVLGLVSADSRLVEAFIGFTVALVAIDFFQRRTRSGSVLSIGALAAAVIVAAMAFGLQRIPPLALLAYGGFGLFALSYLRTSSRQVAHQDAEDWRFLLAATLCFGLIHGFGFAGFLMDTGIRGTSLVAPLLGFNVGVEIGQLGLLIAFVAIGKMLGERWRRRLAPTAAAALCAVGVYWFVGRSLGA